MVKAPLFQFCCLESRNNMLVIGVCGQTGAGKSTLADLLSSHGLGTNLEVDAVGHQLLGNQAIVNKLIEVFGREILDENGSVCRRALGRRAFVDDSSIAALNSIMHPAMIERVKSEIMTAQKDGESSLIVNAALLFSMGLASLCNVLVYVKADAEIRFKRLTELRNWSEVSARERLFAQDEMPDDPSIIVVENNAGSVELEEAVKKLAVELKNRVGEQN